MMELLSDFSQGYPTTTGVKCWWCIHAFKGAPVGLPVAYDISKDAFKVHGCFCSFGCAKAYKQQNALELNCSLEFFRSKAFKDPNPNIIVPAPPREMLKIFGGQQTITEFRKGDKQYSIHFAPLMPWRAFAEEVHGCGRRRDTKSANERPLRIRQAKA